MSMRILFLLLTVLSGIHISYAQLESINIFVDNDITCEGDTVQLNIQIVQNGYNNLQFNWNNENTLSNSNTVNPKAFPAVTTTYLVSVTDIENSITLTDSIEITVLPKPVVYAGDDDTICLNQDFRVINAYTNNTTEFEWEHDGQGQLLQTGTLTPLYIPAGGEKGIVNIVLKLGGILSCQAASDTLTLHIMDAPKVEMPIKADTICTNENYIVTEPTIRNATEFEWLHNGEGSLLNTNTLSPEYVPAKNESGVVDIVFSCSRYGLCTTSDTLKLNIVAKPLVNLKDKVINLCSMSSYYFSGNTIEDATEIKWSHDGSGRLYNTKSANPVYIPGEAESDQVNIFLKATGRCGITNDTVTLNIFNSDAVEVTPDTSICSNESIVLAASEGFSYLWDTGDTSSSIEVNPQKNTTYSVTINNEAGCSLKKYINVEVSNINVEASPDAAICEGGETSISVTSSPNFSYKWDTGETTNQITVKPGSDTDYSVAVTNTEGCTETVSINVAVHESPSFTIEESFFEDKTIEVDPGDYQSYSFIVSGEVVQEGFVNKYFYGNTIETGDSIVVIVTDEFGCSSEDFFYVEDVGSTMQEGPIANAFSPNNDGINDLFLQGRRIVVFDRSNKILFDGSNGWDGTSNGNAMPRGTYYHIVYDTEGNIIYKGPVTLVR
ncbi:MAG: T9SS type B sorting domain-containing protein [Chlorobi bacterium]|nr:T9SS type B sorting domain-containing protein [Chlorobiota bacterium]